MRPFFPNQIMWMVSPDKCAPYRQMISVRGPDEPPPVIEPPPDLTDHYFYNVVLLVGSESGKNIDESPSQHGDGGGVPSTANAKFGTHSIDPGTPSGQYIDFGNKFDDFNISPHQMTEFTLEAWVYLNAAVDPATPQVIFGKSFTSVQWAFMVQTTELRFAYQTLESGFGGNGKFTNIISSGANIAPRQWYYVAVTKDAAKHFRLYVGQTGGVATMVGKRTPNDASIDGTQNIDSLTVGQIGLFGTNDWIGQIDEIRITKGIARYRTDTGFPTPTRAWPRPPPVPAKEEEDASEIRSNA